MIQSCYSKRLLVKPTLSCQLTPRLTRFSRRQSLARISCDILENGAPFLEKWRAECCKRGVRYKRLQTACLARREKQTAVHHRNRWAASLAMLDVCVCVCARGEAGWFCVCAGGEGVVVGGEWSVCVCAVKPVSLSVSCVFAVCTCLLLSEPLVAPIAGTKSCQLDITASSSCCVWQALIIHEYGEPQ